MKRSHIGIVACSAEGAALCYRTICAEGGLQHPEVSMHTHPLVEYAERLERGDVQGIGELMLASARKLAASGAEFLICPDNSIHQAYEYVAARSPLPWLHIGEVVRADASARGFQRLGLLGTRWLVDSKVYPDDYVRPSAAACDEIHRIIMEELVYGVFKAESVAYCTGLIGRMSCDAVILGCTELPLILHDGNSPLPTLDSTRLLARAALRRASARPAPGR